MVTAGEVLIVALPDSVGAQPVETYTDLQLPAFSLRHERAFFWQTAPADSGRHYCTFIATFAEAPPDTLTLAVEVAAP